MSASCPLLHWRIEERVDPLTCQLNLLGTLSPLPTWHSHVELVALERLHLLETLEVNAVRGDLAAQTCSTLLLEGLVHHLVKA